MRAVVCREFGPISSLRLEEGVPAPEIGPGGARIRVMAAGANFPDALMVTGQYQIKPNLPFIPGGEVVGVVEEVGSDGDADLVGERVVAMSLIGGFAEEIVVNASDCAKLTTFDGLTAASFAESYCTAWFALFERGGLLSGEQVLILGAGSGVGHAAVRLATAFGAETIAVASSDEKRLLAREGGAVLAIDPARGVRDILRERYPNGVDLALDPIGGDFAEQALRSLGYGGRLVVIGFASGSIPALPLNHVLLRNRNVIGAEFGSWARRNPSGRQALLSTLVSMVESGKLRVPAPTTFRLEDAPRALTMIMDRQAVGRVVVDVAGSV